MLGGCPGEDFPVASTAKGRRRPFGAQSRPFGDSPPVLTHELGMPREAEDSGSGQRNFVANGGGLGTRAYGIIGWEWIARELAIHHAFI